MKKITMFVGLMFALVIMFPLTSYAATSGNEGTLSWSYDNGKLTISGSGKMKDYDSSNRPGWEQYSKDITNVVIENGVTSIGELAFYQYSNMQNVSIPSTVNEIGRIAFAECENLEKVVIPTGVKKIEYGTFADCFKLKSIDLGNVTAIEDYAFQNACIESFNIGPKLTDLSGLALYLSQIKEYKTSENAKYSASNGILYTDGGKTLFAYPVGNSRTSYTVPSSVTKIEKGAFANSHNLTSVIIGENVRSIGESAFQFADGLTSITIPDNVTCVGDFTFYECVFLKSVTFGKGLTKTSYQMFKYCYSLEKVNFGTSLTELYGQTFADCNSLTSITLPYNIKTIGNGCFGECHNLKTFKSAGLKTIPYQAFLSCSSLNSVVLNNGVKDIYRETFTGCSSLLKINLPASVTFVDAGAFPITTQIVCANSNLKRYGANGYRYLNTVSITGTRKYSEAFEVLKLVNSQRVKYGLPELKMDKDMLETAMKRAAETSILFSHTRPDGSICFSIDSDMTAENIAAGQSSAASVMDSWMNSQGHKANILSTSVKSIGIGCYVQNGVIYWTQCFSDTDTAANCTKPADCKKSQYIGLAVGTFTEAPSSSGVIFGSPEKYTYNFIIKMAKTTQKAHIGVQAQMCVQNPGFTSAYTTLNNTGVSWSSTSTKVATVSSAGKMTGQNAGKCQIVGKLKYSSAKKSVTILANLTATQTKNTKGTVTSAKKKSTKATVKIKNIAGISGYQIQIASNKSMTKSKKTVKTTKTSYTFTKLKKTGKYYVRVRAYKKINGKTYYGKWSLVKKTS